MSFVFVNIFTCSNVVLPITILLLIRTYPLNTISLAFSGDIFIPTCFVVLRQVHNALCKSS